MQKGRRVPVGQQPADAIDSLVAGLQRTRVPFTSNTHHFRRRALPLPTTTSIPTATTAPTNPTTTATSGKANMAPAIGLSRWREDTGITLPQQWTLIPTQQHQTEILLNETANRLP